jgi:hypothetical protein
MPMWIKDVIIYFVLHEYASIIFILLKWRKATKFNEVDKTIPKKKHDYKCNHGNYSTAS